MPPGFYSPYDQQVYDAGFKYIPQSKYLLNPFQIPTDDSTTPPNTGGITSLSRDRGDGFNPYNTDMSKVRQDYNPFPSRQAGEIYSKTFNPQPPFSIKNAQLAYNMATDGINRGFGDMIAKDNPDLKFYRGDKSVFQMQKDADDLIQDAKMRYATEGQYVDPYDPRYSSITEAQKFMDNYPDYYGVPSGVPEPGIPGAIKSYMQNSLLGKGFGMAKDFLGRVLPINERAIMENEARGAGIFTDDIGRIVTDDYNTAGGIMAGYNLNQINEATFDKRRSTIEKTIADKKAKGLDTTALEERLGLLDEAEENILGARKKTQQIYKMRADKRAADKKRKEAEKAAAAAATATGGQTAPPNNDPNQDHDGDGVPNNVEAAGGSYDGGYHGAEGGFENTGSSSSSKSSGGGGNPYGGGPGGLHSGYMSGGRVYYMDGGLADMLEIYD